MAISVEIIKHEQSEKFLICRIEIQPRAVNYFYGQEAPHRTHRWMSTEQWAEFDRTMQELVSTNKLDDLRKKLMYELNGFSLRLKNSKISKQNILEILSNNELKAENAINVIDCKIQYLDAIGKHNGNAVVPKAEELESLDSQEVDFLEYKLPNKKETATTTSQSEEISLAEPALNSQPEIQISCKVAPTSPPIFHEEQSQQSEQSCSGVTLDTSNEKERIERIFSNIQLDAALTTDTNQDRSISPLKGLKDVNDNEKSDFVVLSSPTSETRKRKLCTHNSDNDEDALKKPRSTSSASTTRSQKEMKSNDCCKTPKTETKHSTKHSSSSSSSSTKKKKHKRERSKSPGAGTQSSLNSWLGKGDAKKDEKSAASKSSSSKHGSSSSSSSGRTRSSSESRKLKIEQNDEKVQKTVPPAVKAVERTLSNEEKIELIEEKTEKLKMERETVKVIREALCKKPVKVRTLDLLKLSEKDFLKTFENHREDLQSIFSEQHTQKKFRCVDGVDHFLVINLVNNKIQQKLMEKLSEVFENQINGTPKYGELFSMILMPEWILRVFMSRFKMTRVEAIDHIRAQNAYKAFNSISSEELDKMASKKK